MNITLRTCHAIFPYAIFFFSGFAQTIAPNKTPYLRQASITETTEAVHITANSPRPLLQALDALRHKYGWVVSYEDPAYTSSLDVVEGRDGPSHLLLPAGGSFNVEFPSRSLLEDQTLRLIVGAYNQSSNPSRFELRRSSEGDFYVVGTSARNRTKTTSPQHSLLDTPVTVASRDRTIADTINLLCHELEGQNHVPVSVGILPRALVAYTTVKIGASEVPAREILIRSLKAARRSLYWCLFFDPASKGYVLNIHIAKS
ncbi:MAG: hypothetical protein WA252_01620 [Candidatus Sulfotelmatobacter sp.]